MAALLVWLEHADSKAHCTLTSVALVDMYFTITFRRYSKLIGIYQRLVEKQVATIDQRT